MLKEKRKVDLYSLILIVLVTLLSLFVDFIDGAPIGLLIGVVAGSFVMEKDIRSIEKESFTVVLNLVINLVIYALAFIIAFKGFGTLTFVYTAIGLIGYRNIVLLKLK